MTSKDTPLLQVDSQNIESDIYDDNDDDEGAGDVEINVEDYLKAARRPLAVTRKNKLICSIAFAILIISICAYVSILGWFHSRYTISEDVYFKGPMDIIYVLMLSDVIASCVGIWTCVKKTGPQPMIYSCVWLLLSSLVNVCVTISLTFETKEFRNQKDKRCNKNKGGSPDSVECLPYFKMTIVLWCSLLFFALKFTVIVLCRLNYPQVFNWMMGKDVYVDEDLLPRDNKKVVISTGALAGAYFDPPDLARIAARGSLKDATVITNSESAAIFITRGTDENRKGKILITEDAGQVEKKKSRRSTFVSLSS